MNKWKCNNCETINDIENHVCEVCEGKAPYISKFEYKIDERLGIAECYWIANDYNCLFCQLNDGVLFEPQGNNYTFNVCEHNIIRIIVENEITRVTYDYPINVSNISVDNKIMTQNNIRAERTADNIKKKKAKEESSYVSKLIISILLIPIWLLLMAVITAIIGQNDIINVLGLLPLVLLAYYFFKAICD